MLNRSWSDMNHTFNNLVARSAPPKRRPQTHRALTTTPMRAPSRHQPAAATVATTRHKPIKAAHRPAPPMVQSPPLPTKQTPPRRVGRTPPRVESTPAQVKTIPDEPNPVGSQLRSIERTLSVRAGICPWAINCVACVYMANSHVILRLRHDLLYVDQSF